MVETIVHKHVSEGNLDSIEIGTPGKGGVIKIYMDFSNPMECMKKIQAAAEMKKMAISLIAEGKNVEEFGSLIRDTEKAAEISRK